MSSDLIPIGSVYKLVSPSGKIYIGSTKQPLVKRLGQHRTGYKRFLKGTGTNVTSFILFEESSDIKIELLEEFKECSELELLFAEKKYIEDNICVNRQVPIRTTEEKAKIKKGYNKEYHKSHYDAETKTKACERASLYYTQNKEAVAEYKKEYYEKNKAKTCEKAKEKMLCQSCKCEITICKKSRHVKTKKHIDNDKIFHQTNNATTINITNNYYSTEEKTE
jgi:hypothetical protein